VWALGNQGATAVYGGSSSKVAEDGSDRVLEPHHGEVLELLQVPSAGSLKNDQGAKSLPFFLGKFDYAGLHTALTAALMVADVSLMESKQASRPSLASLGLSGSAAGSSSSSSSSSRSRSISVCSWQQLAPALARMLVGLVQMLPDIRGRRCAVKLLTTVATYDDNVWGRASAAAAVGDILDQLGPAVLHAVQQQQQQDAKLVHEMQWYWSMGVMRVVSAGEQA
jgi:hypothetical protein